MDTSRAFMRSFEPLEALLEALVPFSITMIKIFDFPRRASIWISVKCQQKQKRGKIQKSYGAAVVDSQQSVFRTVNSLNFLELHCFCDYQISKFQLKTRIPSRFGTLGSLYKFQRKAAFVFAPCSNLKFHKELSKVSVFLARLAQKSKDCAKGKA